MKRVRVSFIAVVLLVVAFSTIASAQQLPDVTGIRLGVAPREAYTTMQTSHPKDKVNIHSTQFPTIPQPVLHGFSIVSPPIGATMEMLIADATLPPSKQQVWRVQRYWRQQMNRSNLFASLREKYGKETLALTGYSPV